MNRVLQINHRLLTHSNNPLPFVSQVEDQQHDDADEQWKNEARERRTHREGTGYVRTRKTSDRGNDEQDQPDPDRNAVTPALDALSVGVHEIIQRLDECGGDRGGCLRRSAFGLPPEQRLDLFAAAQLFSQVQRIAQLCLSSDSTIDLLVKKIS